MELVNFHSVRFVHLFQTSSRQIVRRRRRTRTRRLNIQIGVVGHNVRHV